MGRVIGGIDPAKGVIWVKSSLPAPRAFPTKPWMAGDGKPIFERENQRLRSITSSRNHIKTPEGQVAS